MLNKLKKTAALLAAILILCAFNITAYAHEIPDMSQKGSVSIAMQLNGRPVSGAAITLYYVGEINENDGNYSFVWTDELKSCGLNLDDIQSEQPADELENYVHKSRLEGVEQKVDLDGMVKFDNLELGLYLAVQSEVPAGYEKSKAFLISVPFFEDGRYIYSVDASPKLELKTDDKSELTTVPEKPSKPSQPTLPQTGTLNWPVPVLTVLGLALFIMGWAMKYSGRKAENEK